jgi:ABC-type Fe3+/spermidine/putrescine transport system ATPase subunit
MTENAYQNADVRFERVTKRFGRAVAVRDLSLDIPQGMFFSLLGPSGCGKTTTLRLVAGFEQPEEGAVYIRNRNVTGVPPFKRDFAMVFQNFALFPHLNVAENVAFGLKMLRVPQVQRAEEVRNALVLVKLEGFAERYPKQLSGGQQQRVAVARAVVHQPNLILADEPTGNLDSEHGAEVMKSLVRLHEEGTSIVMVTHSPDNAAYAERTVRMLDGRILAEQRT